MVGGAFYDGLNAGISSFSVHDAASFSFHGIGSSSTYIPDGFGYGNRDLCYGMSGGNPNDIFKNGSFILALDDVPERAGWAIGVSLSYIPDAMWYSNDRIVYGLVSGDIAQEYTDGAYVGYS